MYLNDVNGYRAVAFRYFLYLIAIGSLFFAYFNAVRGEYGLALLESLFALSGILILVYLYFVKQPHYLQYIIRVYLFLFYATILLAFFSFSLSITLLAWIFLIPPLSYLLLGQLWGGIYTGVYVFFELLILVFKFFGDDFWANYILFSNITFSLAIVWTLTSLYEHSHQTFQKEQIKLASRDRLTGLFNRSVLKEKYSQCLRYSMKKESVLTLGFINIDWFKLFKENSGFEEGDKLICLVSEVIRSCVRSQDVVFRFGGEEFCILLPDTDINEAQILFDEIRRAAMDKLFNYGSNKLSLTISAGLAQSSKDTVLSDLLKKADQCLYKAKELGHNQVVIAE